MPYTITRPCIITTRLLLTIGGAYREAPNFWQKKENEADFVPRSRAREQ